MWAETAVTALLDGEGRMTGLLGVTRDISERKKAEEKLQEALARVHGIRGPAVDVRQITGEAARLVPAELAQRHKIFPYRAQGKTLFLLMVDPQDMVSRLAVCRECPWHRGGWCEDARCGCKLRRKARLATETCPRGYWPALDRRHA